MKSLRPFKGIALLMLILITLIGCSSNTNRKGLIEIQGGMFGQKIKIRTMPTKARIFINEREIGESPLTYTLTNSEQRMFNIKAVPIYPNQYTQNIFLMVPPLPKSMTIYMNHIPENYDRTKDKPFTPPEKPAPIIITTVERDTVYINKIQKDEVVITMPVIYFDTASYNIRPEFENDLQTFITAMKHRQEFKIDIYGYADKRNNDEYNRTLSLNRANAVKDYLIRNGIKESRLSVFGLGISKTIDATGAEVDLQANRKATFVIRK